MKENSGGSAVRVVLPSFAHTVFSSAAAPTLVLCVLLGVGATSLGATEAAAPGEKETPAPAILSIRPPVYDWGRVYRGEQLAHVFVLENTGGSRLDLLEIKPACGCTLIDEATVKKSLAPGESTQLTVKIDTSTFRGDVKKYTEILSNSSGAPDKLWTRGKVEELLKLEPSAPVVEAVCGAPRRQVATRVLVTAGIETALRVLSVKSKSGLLKVLHRQEADGLVRLDLAPNLTASSKPGIETETLITEVVVAGKRYILHVPITVALRPRIGIKPRKSVYFRRKTTQELRNEKREIVKRLTLHSRGGPGHSFKITAVKTGKDFFGTRLSEITTGKAYTLEVRLERLPAAGVRFVKDVIEIHTDDPLVPTVKVPVRAQF